MNKVVKTYENDRYMNSYDHNKICFGPDEKYLIAGNCIYWLLLYLADGTLVSWTIEGKFYKTLNKGCHEGVVLCVSYHPVSG